MITSNKLNMHGLFKCFKFGSSINFQSVNILSDRAWIVRDLFYWIRLHYNLTGRGKLNKREEGMRLGGLFEGGDNFKYFILRGRLFEGGDYSMDGYYSRYYGNLTKKENKTFAHFTNFYLFFSTTWSILLALIILPS